MNVDDDGKRTFARWQIAFKREVAVGQFLVDALDRTARRFGFVGRLLDGLFLERGAPDDFDVLVGREGRR